MLGFLQFINKMLFPTKHFPLALKKIIKNQIARTRILEIKIRISQHK
jgi:hypothetical protein